MFTPQDLGLTKVAYSVNETISILNLGRTYLYERVRAGDLKATKVGTRKTLFLATHIADFVSKLQDGE
jgi:excisionase family DNA binding protein